MDNRSNKMLIDATHPEETRVVVLRNGRVEEFDFESASRRPLRGNIYLAKVTRVEPSLQAAFVEYGGNRHGFLAFAEIHPDYYQIPKADREALLEEEAAAELEADQEADERAERLATRGRRPDRHQAAAGDGEQPSLDHDGTGDGTRGDTRDDSGPDMPAAELVPTAASDDPVADIAPTYETRAEVTGLADAMLTADRAGDLAAPHAAPAEPLFERQGQPRAEVASPGAPAAAPVDHDHDHSQANGHDDHEPGHDSDHIEEVPANTEEPEVLDGHGDQPAIADASEELPERPRRQRRRSYKIQEVIKRRQIMLIQVVKEERGTKGAALTTYLSLAGRYTVLMPNTGRGGGISRKITQPQDRKRLKAIAQDLDVPEGMGLIIRTAGAARSMPEIRRDYDYLLRLWDSVRELTLSSTAPSLVYEEGSLIKRSIRDQYTKDVDEIVVAGDEAHREAQDFMRMLMPSHVKNVILHDRPEPLFARYPAVDRQLNALFSPTVPLKSGGYLVINQTEALVAIDINSGKATREFNIEDTALNTNLEASDEIARQLKLRDLAGLIVVDFIDMEEKRNNRAVERRLKDALRFDRARIQVGRISHFGLLEMSRQRMRTGVLEGSSSKCPHCEGSGIIRSVESVALSVLRGLEEHLQRDSRASVNILAHQDVALYILNHKRAYVADIERRYGVFVAVLASDKYHGTHFAIERSATPPPQQQRRQPDRAAVTMASGFDGQEPIEEFDEADDPRPSSPVIESDIETIDTEDADDDDRRDRPRDRDRGSRGGDRDGGRDRGGRERGGRDRDRARGSDRGSDRGGHGDRDRGDRDRGERRNDVPRDQPRMEDGRGDDERGSEPRSLDVRTPDGRAPENQGPENQGDEPGSKRGRRRRRGRGRDRERGDGWRDRTAVPPADAGAGPQPASDGAPRDSDAFEQFDEGAPDAPVAAASRPATILDDHAPELINGDGIEVDAADADAPAGTDETRATADGEVDGDGRRRRRRGRRGGRRNGRDRDDEGTADAPAETAGATPEITAADAEADTVPTPRAASAVRIAEPPPIVVQPVVSTPPEPLPLVEMPAPEPRPIATEPVIESDAPAQPARRGWWRTRGIG